MENKYKLLVTGSFKKDYKKMLKQGKDFNLLDAIVERLLKGEALPQKNKDHALNGNWQGYRECHITPDWLLIYQIREEKLILVLTRTGSHSELFF